MTQTFKRGQEIHEKNVKIAVCIMLMGAVSDTILLQGLFFHASQSCYISCSAAGAWSFSVSELAAPGVEVGRLTATDADLGENALLEFTILDSEEAEIFNLTRRDKEAVIVLNKVGVETREQSVFKADKQTFTAEDTAACTLPVHGHIMRKDGFQAFQEIELICFGTAN